MSVNNDRATSRVLARQRRAEEKAIHEAARAERLRLEQIRRPPVFTESPTIYIARGSTPRDVQIDYLHGRAVTLRDHALKRAKFYSNAYALARSEKGKTRATMLRDRAKKRASEVYEEGMRELREYIEANPVAPKLPPLPY